MFDSIKGKGEKVGDFKRKTGKVRSCEKKDLKV